MPQDRELARVSTGSTAEILSVSQLNRSVRDLLEHRFPLLRVHGEVSNYVLARSGHAYFSLKDSQAQVRCAMFRNRGQLLDWTPAEGMQVEVHGLVTLYEPRGDFQLVVDSMRRAGRGALYEAFQQLKDRLEREGLFAEELKRPLPKVARSIGIVTSLQAAALRDVLTTLRRRDPSIAVVVYPTPVQGNGAGASVAAAIETAGRRAECDLLIICRGGGSIEDLWAFNDEAVARAIRACPVPVVSGVGHETDFTIADFAADRRAPTPTAAAEVASSSRAELLSGLGSLVAQLSRRMQRDLEWRAQTADSLARRVVHPGRRIAERSREVSRLAGRLAPSMAAVLGSRRWRTVNLVQRLDAAAPDLLSASASIRVVGARLGAALRTTLARREELLQSFRNSLGHLDPQRVLERGYGLVRDSEGHIVRDASAVAAGERIEITLSRGKLAAQVLKSSH